MNVEDIIRDLHQNYDKPMGQLLIDTAEKLGELAMVNYLHQIGTRGCSESAALDEVDRQTEAMIGRLHDAARNAFGTRFAKLRRGA